MADTDFYYTLANSSEGLYKEKGSKFMAFAYPVKDEDDIKEWMDELKQRFHNARHHCYAWKLGTEGDHYRANDDGEPSGTAGNPILGQIRSRNLTYVLVVVVRYFGGTKLGVSGLIRAYKTAAADALDHATIVERTINREITVRFPYDLMNPVMRVISQEEANIIEQTFQADCLVRLAVRLSLVTRLAERLNQLDGIHVEIPKGDEGIFAG